MVPFQKGPYDEGGRMRGFLLPLLEAAVVVLVLFLLIFLNFEQEIPGVPGSQGVI